MDVTSHQIHLLRAGIGFRVAADGCELLPNPSAAGDDGLPSGG